VSMSRPIARVKRGKKRSSQCNDERRDGYWQ
jgi:hypothetical protein